MEEGEGMGGINGGSGVVKVEMFGQGGEVQQIQSCECGDELQFVNRNLWYYAFLKRALGIS